MSRATTEPDRRAVARAPGSGPAGREPCRGYGLTALAFDSGDALALRVAPESGCAPFRVVWHKPPAGSWSAYVDGGGPAGPRPRPAEEAPVPGSPARIDVSWSRGRVLAVRMEEPSLAWAVRLRRSPFVRLVNRALPRLSRDAYRRRPGLALVRRLAARALGPAPTVAARERPAGPAVVPMPTRLLVVDDATVVLDGRVLGEAEAFAQGPDGDDEPGWPVRGVLVEGEVCVPEDRRPRRPDENVKG